MGSVMCECGHTIGKHSENDAKCYAVDIHGTFIKCKCQQYREVEDANL